MNFRNTVILQMFLSVLTLSAENYGCCIEADQKPPSSDILQLQAFTVNQSLVVRWLSNESHSQEQKEQFELQIASAGSVYNLSVEHRVGGDGMHTLEWTSPLPLECADHSVRIRRFHDDPASSSWSQWTTHYGLQREPAKTTRIFPFDRVMLEGSRPWLCCIPPPGTHITEMHFNKYKYNMVSIGESVKAIQAHSLNISSRAIKRLQFKCKDSTSKLTATLITPSIPPEKPRNFSCETPDLKKVFCRWDPGRDDYLSPFKKRKQTLYINNQNPGNAGAPYSVECDKSSCEFPVVTGLAEYHVELMVSNPLGKQSAQYSFNISDRVFPVVEMHSVWPRVMEANVSWTTKDRLSPPDLLCQVALNHRSQAAACSRKDGGLCQATVRDLLPNTLYSARVCCGLEDKDPGGWSKDMTFSTDPLVTLDLWRRINTFSNNSRSVTLVWKLHAPGTASEVVVQGYKIQCSQEGEFVTTWADTGQSQAEILIGPGRCEVTVQAALPIGSSVPASITIPAVEAGEPVVEQRVSFRPHLSWTGQDWCHCGYTVEWCIMESVPCALRWVKLPTSNTTLLLKPGDYDDGVRYTFNIYGCTENGHKLLEIQTGYFLELRPVARPHLKETVATTSSSVTLQWLYDEDDPAHPGTITGYLVRVQEVDAEGSPSQTSGPFNVTVTDPRRKWVTVAGLQADTTYQFDLSALTKEGSGPVITTTVRTGSDRLVYWVKILIPLVLLLACSIFLGHQRKTLESWWNETFAFPDVMRMKAFELEIFLEKTSKRLDTKQLDECICCDIEIINTKLLSK